MKVQIWDILAILLLLAALAVAVVVGSIFMDPYSSLNPFPPPQLPSLLVIPTASSTPLRLAPTWTPVGFSGTVETPTFAPSSTPLPTSTGIILPSSTNTATATITPTNTATVTRTPTETKINLTATYNALQTEVWRVVTQNANATGTAAARTMTAAVPTVTPTATTPPTVTPTATTVAPPPP